MTWCFKFCVTIASIALVLVFAVVVFADTESDDESSFYDFSDENLQRLMKQLEKAQDENATYALTQSELISIFDLGYAYGAGALLKGNAEQAAESNRELLCEMAVSSIRKAKSDAVLGLHLDRPDLNLVLLNLDLYGLKRWEWASRDHEYQCDTSGTSIMDDVKRLKIEQVKLERLKEALNSESED